MQSIQTAILRLFVVLAMHQTARNSTQNTTAFTSTSGENTTTYTKVVQSRQMVPTLLCQTMKPKMNIIAQVYYVQKKKVAYQIQQI